MGGAAGIDLAVAVANAGAMGMLGGASFPPEAVAGALDSVAAQTDGAFGINFLAPFLDVAAVEAASTRAKFVEFFYDQPDPSLVSAVHRGGALAGWQVGSLDE